MRWGEKARRKEWEGARNIELGSNNGYCICEREIGNSPWRLLRQFCGSSVKRWRENRGQKRQEKTNKYGLGSSINMTLIHNDNNQSDPSADVESTSEEGVLEERNVQEPSPESGEIVAESARDAVAK